MNLEIPKPEKIEDGTDLYDGMLFKALERLFYVSDLDDFSLHKLNERVREYYDIINSDDYVKAEKLSERLGIYINKVKLRQVLEYSDAIILDRKRESDIYDVSIISSLDNHLYLDHLSDIDLARVVDRLQEYNDILSGSNDKEKDRLTKKIGQYIAADSIKSLFEYAKSLLSNKK